MLSIRLTRVGKRKDSRFRIIVQEKTKAPSSSFLELLGSYNPHTDPSTVNLDSERIKYWITQGAQPSDTVHNILIDQKIIEGEKVDLGRKKEKKSEKKEETKESEDAAPQPEGKPASGGSAARLSSPKSEGGEDKSASDKSGPDKKEEEKTEGKSPAPAAPKEEPQPEASESKE